MNEKKPLKVIIPPQVQTGVFSNVAQVNVTPREVILDFALVQPNREEAVMVSRVILTKDHARELNKVINQVLEKDESGKGTKK